MTDDLTVIGWNAAFLYDSDAGAETAIQLLEYANSQLLEFRHYDELLTGDARQRIRFSAETRNAGPVAAGAIGHEPAHGAARYGGAHRACRQLHQVFERHVCRPSLPPGRSQVGVPDYKDLVAQKLKTAEELYHYMVDQFNQSRAFFLEATVVIILVIELIFLFRGRPF